MSPTFLRILALATLTILALVMVFGELADSRDRIDEAERMMTAQGYAIAEIVGESSRHGLEVFTRWEKEQQAHLLDNANWLAWVHTQRNLTAADLDKFASDLGLWRIMFFDAQGKLEKANLPEGAVRRGPGQLPSSFLTPLVTGRQRTGILGLKDARLDGEPRQVAGVTRPGGGAVVVSTRAQQVDLARTELAPGHLIKSLGRAHGLFYVALQDRHGVIASSTTQVGFTLPGSDPDLFPLAEGQPFVSRRFVSDLGPVLEVARVLPLDDAPEGGKTVLLRVGLDATLLTQLEHDTQRGTILRIVWTAAGLVLISVILLAWQRQGVLRREVEKVSRELKLKEEEARRTEKLVAMGNLAAGVAHEIRNPLNTIHLIAQNLGREENLGPGVQTKAGQIRDESSRIESIVQQFLAFARPRAPLFQELDLAQVVSQTVAVHQSAQAEGPVAVTFKGPDTLAADLDREMVVEIVDNLVRNAIEAQPEGGIVQVVLERERHRVWLSVTDQGPGVTPEDRARIFDLYYTTKPAGTGLGLSLVSRMVTAMGGHLELEEPVGEPAGARFVVTFPLSRSRT
jgi:signal transduction histidine kinase|nr:ATP-binding protein [Candidatus Krumholzibacteria bacterium]